MDTLILFMLVACAVIGFAFGAAAGAVAMYDSMNTPSDPGDDSEEDSW